MTLDANMNTSGIEERFEQIAKMLFESFAHYCPVKVD